MIKNIVLFFAVIIFSSSLFANDINELIIKIKNAKPSEKRLLMNELKLKLRTANQISRQHAMSELKKAFASNKLHTNTKKPHIKTPYKRDKIKHINYQNDKIKPHKRPNEIKPDKKYPHYKR